MSEEMGRRQPAGVRIGAVRYLNAWPLTFCLPPLIHPAARIVTDLPSRLADALAAGRLDVALVPSIEYLRNPGTDDRLRRLHRQRGPGAEHPAL